MLTLRVLRWTVATDQLSLKHPPLSVLEVWVDRVGRVDGTRVAHWAAEVEQNDVGASGITFKCTRHDGMAVSVITQGSDIRGRALIRCRRDGLESQYTVWWVTP